MMSLFFVCSNDYKNMTKILNEKRNSSKLPSKALTDYFFEGNVYFQKLCLCLDRDLTSMK